MTNNKPQNETQTSDTTDSHPIATGLGAVGGSVAGVALGRSLGGKVGATIGGVAGAIAGGMAGNTIAEVAEEVAEELKPTLELGANNKAIELPRHYSWAELQALSKPQGGKLQNF